MTIMRDRIDVYVLERPSWRIVEVGMRVNKIFIDYALDILFKERMQIFCPNMLVI